MIVQELIRLDEKIKDSSYLVRTYSDAGFYIEREGAQYAEAIDLPQFNYTYTETNIPLPKEEI